LSSTHYLDFLGTVWSSLPEEDQARLGEFWEGLEQVFASVYQKYLEDNLNSVNQTLQAFSTERWLPYTFDSATALSKPATYASTQDISLGINLTSRYLLNIQVNDSPAVEVDCRGVTPGLTTIGEIVAKLNLAHRFTFAKTLFSDSVVQLTAPVVSGSSKMKILATSNPAANAAEFILGVDDSQLPLVLPKFPLLFQSSYPLLASIPELQDAIRDESVTMLLAEGVDYEIQLPSIIALKKTPPAAMWARRSLFDQENPWNNFGYLIDVYQKNSPRYVSVIQGLWYAFWNGPKPENVLRSLHLLLGLPTVKAAGIVTAVSPTSIQTTSLTGVVDTFVVPPNLSPVVIFGQSVAQFDPLVSGIVVFDKINKPGFIESEVGRTGIQRFLLDGASRGIGDTDETRAMTLLEENCFLPQISVDAFINPDVNLGNVKTFLDAIKPLNKAYIFQVSTGNILEQQVFGEYLSELVSVDLTGSIDSNQTSDMLEADLLDYESNENSGLNLDPNGVLFQETLSIDVFSFNVLIDSYTA